MVALRIRHRRLNADLDRRHGWATELTFLLERHPRTSWATKGTAGVHFWLEVHDHFRRDCASLEVAADDYRHERVAAAQLAVIATSRLGGLVANLHGHHQIEDFHYFPAFRQAEPRLTAGFDVLERDHAALQQDVAKARAAVLELRTAAKSGTDSGGRETLVLAAEHYIDATARLCRRVCRHLSDEEELVMPLLIERGDY